MFVTELAGRGSASKSARGKLPALSSHECAPPPKLSNAAAQFDANPMPSGTGPGDRKVSQRSPRLLSTGGAPRAWTRCPPERRRHHAGAPRSELSPPPCGLSPAGGGRLAQFARAMDDHARVARLQGRHAARVHPLPVRRPAASARFAHITAAAKALTGSKRATAFLVHAESDALLRVGDRGEVLTASPESVSRGTSFAAHCARSAKPLVIGLPGSPQRAAPLHRGQRHRVPAGGVLVRAVPDHVGNVLAVTVQVRAPRSDSVQAARASSSHARPLAVSSATSAADGDDTRAWPRLTPWPRPIVASLISPSAPLLALRR